jgi:pSer/pThr/pTyr-binding forkhead associated (FHA) protein
MKVWTIGSISKNDLVIMDAGVEPRHAQIQLDEGTILVKNLSTTNTTYVNDWQVRQKVIQPNDKLRIGHTLVDIDELLLKEPKVGEKEKSIVLQTPINETSLNPLSVSAKLSKQEAAKRLEVELHASVEDIIAKYKKEETRLKKFIKDAPLPNQKKEYQNQLHALTNAKEVLLEGIDDLPLTEPVTFSFSNNQHVNLTPDKKTNPEDQGPKKWYHNYPLLWGTVGALLAWSVFLMYERFADSRARLNIEPQERIRYDFLHRNFRPQPLKVRNETGTVVQVVGFVALTYDSTGKEWRVKKIFKETPFMLKQGESKVIEIAGNVIFADIIFEYTDESISGEPMRLQFVGSLSPDNEDYNLQDKAIELRLPNQRSPRTYTR